MLVTLGGMNRAGGLAVSDRKAYAPAGSTQTDATQITSQLADVTGADGTKGVILPKNINQVWVYSDTATNGLKVYPPSGMDINDGTTNAAVTIEGKTAALFVKVNETTFSAIFTADS